MPRSASSQEDRNQNAPTEIPTLTLLQGAVASLAPKNPEERVKQAEEVPVVYTQALGLFQRLSEPVRSISLPDLLSGGLERLPITVLLGRQSFYWPSPIEGR